MKDKNKKFDAVDLMRNIRDQLHQEYEKNPEKRKYDLERIKKKYFKQKTTN